MQAEITETTPLKLTFKAQVALMVFVVSLAVGAVSGFYQIRTDILAQAAADRDKALTGFVTREELQTRMDDRFERVDGRLESIREEVRALKSAVERIK